MLGDARYFHRDGGGAHEDGHLFRTRNCSRGFDIPYRGVVLATGKNHRSISGHRAIEC